MCRQGRSNFDNGCITSYCIVLSRRPVMQSKSIALIVNILGCFLVLEVPFVAYLVFATSPYEVHSLCLQQPSSANAVDLTFLGIATVNNLFDFRTMKHVHNILVQRVL